MNPASSRARRAVRWWTPPVLAWLGSGLLTWLVARASGVAWWTTAGRERWDSTHYLAIARDGYEMFWCRDRPGYEHFPDVLCGNVAWFPGYPMAVRAVAATGLSYDLSAVVVAETSLFGMFGVLWWLLGGRLTRATGLTLAIGAVFPGGIYFHAVFPIALGTLALLVAVAGVKRGSWLLAAAGGFVAASCHLVGAVGVGMLALSVFFAWKDDPPRTRVLKGAGAALVALGGVLGAKWVMWRDTGVWDAYERHNESAYGQGSLRNPFSELRVAYDMPFRDLYFRDDDAPWLVRHSLEAHHLQLWLNGALVLLLVGHTAWRLWRDRRLDVEDWAAVLLLGAVFCVPFLAGAKMSWYRNHAQMFVALLLVRRLPWWLQVLVLVACAYQYVHLAAMVLAGVLV